MIQDFKIINVEKILKDKTLPNWVLKAAFELTRFQYLPTGDYFEKLDDVEVCEIKDSLNYIDTINAKYFSTQSKRAKEVLQNLSLLCLILALGEGEIETSAESLSSMLNYLRIIVTVESLHREGKVQAIRKNYSLFAGNKPLIDPKEGETQT